MRSRLESSTTSECPHGTEAPANEAMDYQAVLAGLYRELVQQGAGGLTIDFIDEDALTIPQLLAYKAVVVTEPSLPEEGQAALGEFVRQGGHLLTVSGAATRDRLNESCTALTSVTGLAEQECAEVPGPHGKEKQLCRRQECFVGGTGGWAAPVANGTGTLGPIAAWGVRGYMQAKQLPADAVVEASFADASPAIVQRTIGKGSATHFAFLPGVHFRGGFDIAAPKYDDPTNFTDGTRPYLESFLANAGVVRSVQLSAEQVEAPLRSSQNGSVLTLLNWGQHFVHDLALTVLVPHDVAKVWSVNGTRANLAFTCTPDGTKAGEGQFRLKFGLGATLFHADFVMIHAKA